MTKSLYALLAGVALVAQPTIAIAQEAECVVRDDVRDAVIYAMPLLASSARTQCAGSLDASGYLATSSDSFVARYAAEADQAWPGALRIIKMFMAREGNNDTMDMIGSMPDEALRPFVTAMAQQMLAEEFPVEECATIEAFMEQLAPLPPQNMGGLVSVIMARISESEGDAFICGT